METVDDVLDGLENGVQHALQAGIDRVNQSAKTLSHEIKDWRIMQQSFTYSVSLFGSHNKSNLLIDITKYFYVTRD